MGPELLRLWGLSGVSCIAPPVHPNVSVHKYRGLQLESIAGKEGACFWAAGSCLKNRAGVSLL